MRTDLNGRGIINILAAGQLILKPRLYSSFPLWLLSELFENLPEVGDLNNPRRSSSMRPTCCLPSNPLGIAQPAQNLKEFGFIQPF